MTHHDEWMEIAGVGMGLGCPLAIYSRHALLVARRRMKNHRLHGGGCWSFVGSIEGHEPSWILVFELALMTNFHSSHNSWG